MKNKLQNGKKYNLTNLFNADRKIIIPDLQRDYTWGDKKHGEQKEELVSGFVKNLIEQFKESKENPIQLGMIYAYENPINHINLADGQQRITTLFLLIGMLNRATNSKFQKYLISDFELKNDDQEPYLQYAIRESTLYFLSDLVVNFFLNNEIEKVDDIKKQKWYFSEYDNDPSIKSMLSAIKIIEDVLQKDKDIKLSEFGKWLTERVEFFYFDMVNREHGEEMFVVINTTGEPLTVTENLKPILLGDITDNKYNEQWEEREKFFWQNKKDDEQEADNGLKDFLTWYVKIQEKQDSVNIHKYFLDKKKGNKTEQELDKLNIYFEGLKKVIELLKKENIQKQFKFINAGSEVEEIIGLRNLSKEKQQNILLPLLYFVVKYQEKDVIQFLRRLRKNYFDKEWKDRNHNYLDWRYILQIIDKSDSTNNVLLFDTSELDKLKKEDTIPEWYNEEEKLKDKLKIKNKELIEKWEDYKDFMGDLSILLKSHLIEGNATEIPALNNKVYYNIDELKRIFENYKLTVGKLKQQDKENYKLSNLFRLFRLFSGIVEIGHFYRTSWDFRGVSFSSYNRKHFSSIEFLKLLKSENLENYSIGYIKDKVNEENIFNLKEKYDINKFIKAWLTLKVFNANEEKVALEYYDGNYEKNNTGVSAFWDKDTNRLTSNLEFSLENSICGFAVTSGWSRKSHIHYTKKDLWLKPNIIDTPFAGIKYQNFENKEEPNEVSLEELGKNREKINSIIKKITE